MQAPGWSWLRLSIRHGPRPWLYAGKTRRACELLHSPHAPHLSPAFQRGPDAALEPEAIDRRGGVDRADAAQADTGPLEAALLQHVARRRIGDARGRVQFVVLEIAERMVDQRAHRLGRVAFAPERLAEPVAERGRAVAKLDAAGADQRVVRQRDDVLLLVRAFVRPADPVLRVAELVRMRNARRVLGDVAVVGERRDHFSVPEARRAQDQPRGLEDGDTAFSESLRWDVFQAGHGRLLGLRRLQSKALREALRG